MSPLSSLNTPAALIDVPRMQRNIDRMQRRMDSLKVKFRPHVKTSKCAPVAALQLQAGGCGVTVSTLLEAEQFYADGITDIVYAVGMVANKLPQALALRRPALRSRQAWRRRRARSPRRRRSAPARKSAAPMPIAAGPRHRPA